MCMYVCVRLSTVVVCRLIIGIGGVIRGATGRNRMLSPVPDLLTLARCDDSVVKVVLQLVW
jgi:hypothetical protein